MKVARGMSKSPERHDFPFTTPALALDDLPLPICSLLTVGESDVVGRIMTVVE